MKKMNVYKAGTVAAVLISVLGICAFSYGEGRKGENVTYEDFVVTDDKGDGDKEEQYRIFIKKQLELMVETLEQISGCNIEFEVNDNTITKVDVVLEVAKSFEGDKEELMENIQKAVASAIGLPVEDVFVRE